MPTNPGNNSRRLLIAREKRDQLRTIAEFAKIRDKIAERLADVLARIDKARRTEGNAPISLLLENARLRALLDAVTDEMFIAGRRLGLQTADAQEAAIRIAKGQAMDTIELKADLGFFDTEATKELIGIAGDGQPLAKHFIKLAIPVRQAMFDVLFFGIAAGETNRQIAKNVNAVVGNGAAAAMTIVRTETNRAYREASRKFYADTPAVIGWRWVAALDLRTCPICWAMHGQVFKTRTKFGTHPNCRCTMVPVFRGDPKVPTGGEIFAGLTEAEQRAILGPKKLELWKQGAGLTDFVEKYKSAFGVGRRIVPLDRISFEAKPRATSIIDRTTPKPAMKPAASTKTTLTAASFGKPGDPLPAFESTYTAGQYMRGRYPGIEFDLGEIDVKDGFLQTQLIEIDRLLSEYPEAAERLKYFGTYENRIPPGSSGRFTKNSNAHCAVDGSFLALNPKEFRDMTKYVENKDRNFKIGWSSSDSISGTVTHEFGHAVDAWLTSLDKHSPLNIETASGPLVTVEDLRMAILKKFKPKPGELSSYAIYGRGRRQRVEQFAEAFAQFHTRPAATLAEYTRMQERLIEIVRRGTFKDAPIASDVSEIRAAKKTVNEIYKELGLTPPFPKNEL
jgi:SPP1 gp7 family putative phage head morphogenesis protein